MRLNSLSHPPSIFVGAERVALTALQALQIRALPRSARPSPRQASATTALLLARTLKPAFEPAASCWRRIRDLVASG